MISLFHKTHPHYIKYITTTLYNVIYLFISLWNDKEITKEIYK